MRWRGIHGSGTGRKVKFRGEQGAYPELFRVLHQSPACLRSTTQFFRIPTRSINVYKQHTLLISFMTRGGRLPIP